MMKKKYLYTPGPVPMYPQTLKIGAMQTPYFRNQWFADMLLECEQLLLGLLHAPQNSRVVFLTASGTAAMEAVVQNLLDAQQHAVVINGGGFGQRFVDLCRLHHKPCSEYPVADDNLRQTEQLSAHTDVDTLLINGHETTTGLLYDLEAVGQFCKNNRILHIVDAISMFVTDELDMQKQNIDALIISSHKGLALPPGLSMVVLTEKAIDRLQPVHQLYFDFADCLQNGQRGQTPFTPAVTIIMQLHQRLQQISDEGIAAHIAKAASVAGYFRKQIKKLPLRVYSTFMPNAMTALSPVDGCSARQLVADLDARYDIVVTPNGGALQDRVFRVAHMGNMDTAYMDILIDALHDYFDIPRQGQQ